MNTMKITRIVLLITLLLVLPALLTGNDSAMPDRAKDYALDQAQYDVAAARTAGLQEQVIQERQNAIARSRQSPEYRQAVEATQSTNEIYQLTRRQVQDNLSKTDPKYKALLAQRDAIQLEIEAARKAGNTTYDGFQELYKKKETVTNAIRDIETVALDAAGASETRRQWAQATREVEAQKQKARLDAETAPAVVQSKEQLAAAQQNAQEAYVKLEGSRAAYDEAEYQQEKLDDYRSHYAPGLDWWGDSGYYYQPTVYRARYSGGVRAGAVRGGGVRR